MAKRKRKTKTKKRSKRRTSRTGGKTGRTPAATRLTPKKRAKFLETLEETGNVTEAVKSIGASRQGLYKARGLDDQFRAEWADALESASDNLIAEARRRGYAGIEKPLHYQGQLTGHVVQEYSDILLIFLIKGLRPEFRDSKGFQATVQTDGKATVVFESNGREVVDG